jgi:hypothetical protein
MFLFVEWSNGKRKTMTDRDVSKPILLQTRIAYQASLSVLPFLKEEKSHLATSES